MIATSDNFFLPGKKFLFLFFLFSVLEEGHFKMFFSHVKKLFGLLRVCEKKAFHSLSLLFLFSCEEIRFVFVFFRLYDEYSFVLLLLFLTG